MVCEWNCGCIHLPQSTVFNAVSDFSIPRGDAKFTRDFGTGVLNYGDAKITVTPVHCVVVTLL